ncbi:MAG: DUF397 domain-containing protein [Pseudonocardiaceae bacterium]
MSRPDFRHAVWHKSSRSHGNGDCVEVAFTSTLVGVRDSKDPTGPMLAVGSTEWSVLLGGIHHGEFDPS